MSEEYSISLAFVSEVSGNVIVKSREGSLRFLRKGDAVYEGDVIVTEDGGSVKLVSMNGAGLEVMQGKELVLSAGLFEERIAAGDEDSASSVFSVKGSANAAISGNLQRSEAESTGIHGYLRVGRLAEHDGNSPYTFVSYTGNYSSSSEGRTTGVDSFLEGRATTDDRIQMSIQGISIAQSESVLRVVNIPEENPLYRLQAQVPLPVDDVPAAVDDTYTTAEDTAISGNVSSNDTPSGNGGNAWSLVSSPLHGVLALSADGSFTYTPNSDYTGPDSFTYRITDIDGDSSTATASIKVTSVNDAPTANPDLNSVKVNNTIEVGMLNGVIQSAGNSTGTDTDPEGDSLTVTGVVSGTAVSAAAVNTAGTSNVGSSTAGTYGHLTLQSDGSYTYSADTTAAHALLPGASVQDVFSYAISDGNGGTSYTTLTIAVTGTGSIEEEVDEDALTNPPNLSQGDDETGSAVSTFSGMLSVLFPAAVTTGASYRVETDTTAGASDPLVHTTSGDVLSSQGVQVHYTADPNGTVLTGYADVDGDGSYTSGNDRIVFTLTITDASAGAYGFTLNDQVDHPANGDTGILSIDLAPEVSMTEGDGDRVKTSAGLVIDIQNDIPVAASNAQLMTSKPLDTNLTLILDRSSSMWSTDPDFLIIEASKNLIDEYDALGEVRVQIIVFDTDARTLALWASAEDAKEIIETLDDPNGNTTNYDAALQKMMETYGEPGKLATVATQNVSYFISDGQPNDPAASAGIDSCEQAQWESFLKTYGIDSYAFGVGYDIHVDALQPIAYDGTDGMENVAVIIPDVSDLSAILSDTVVPGSTTGTLIKSAGADAPARVASITIDGTTYTYDPANGGSIMVNGTDRSSFDPASDTLTITTLGFGSDLSVNSKIVVNMDTGVYTYYTPRTVVIDSFTDTFSYVIRDYDGDTSSSMSSIT
ncbi:MAG: VWA domain-containing protein, partial [Chlorobiaceae bacterium]|nr:VWA domain-containing protein [Chlorobiaceae bacterium]